MSTIQDTDLLLVHRGGKDYKITAKDFKEYFKPPNVWDELAAEKDAIIWHLINEGEQMQVGWRDNVYAIFDMNGQKLDIEFTESKGFIIPPNLECIIVSSKDARNFYNPQPTASFSLGPYTDTARCVDFEACFRECWKFKGEGVQYMDVSNARYFDDMFAYCWEFNGDVSRWDVTGGDDFNEMFLACWEWDGDVSKWDVSTAIEMGSMFAECKKFNSDLSGWDVSNVDYMGGMFREASMFFADLTEWCVKLIPQKPDNFDKGSYFEGDTRYQPCWGHCPPEGDACVTYPWTNKMRRYHLVVPTQTTAIEINCNGSSDQKIWNMDTLEELPNNAPITAPGEYMIAGNDHRVNFQNSKGNWTFGGQTNIKGRTSLKNFMTNCVDFAGLFGGVWNTSEVVDMEGMMEGCAAFTGKGSSGNYSFNDWDTSKVTNMNSMFSGCQLFNISCSSWCVSQFPTEPTDFAKECYSWEGRYQPKWGKECT